MMANFLVQHNISLLTADHLSSLFKEVFPDNKIAKNMLHVEQKQQPFWINYLRHTVQILLYDIAKSNHTQSAQMAQTTQILRRWIPICVKNLYIKKSRTVFNISCGQHHCRRCIYCYWGSFWKQSNSLGKSCTLECRQRKYYTWESNSNASRFLEKNENVFIVGCPCHLAHIAVSNDHDAFSGNIEFNIENAIVDLFYWFDESAKWKGKLREYFEFCNQE